MKMVIVALFDSVGSIFNVMIVVMVVWLMFAILGVNLFSGKFYECSITPYKISTELQCLAIGGEWINSKYNFDHVG